MSFFNELAGGPANGHKYLLDSNIDWGQDMLYFKHWLEKHPEVHPLYMESQGFVTPQMLGIEASQAPQGPKPGETDRQPDSVIDQIGPRPGWYAMSVHRIHRNTERFQYFLKFRPIGMIGYSIYLYNITVQEANQVRKKLGLAELPGGASK
jgi:hypothetical protein